MTFYDLFMTFTNVSTPYFRDLLHDSFCMTEEILMDRVFRAFDEDLDGFISMKDWVQGLSTFLRGSLEEKTKCKLTMTSLCMVIT